MNVADAALSANEAAKSDDCSACGLTRQRAGRHAVQ
jgi:hypothetical protein